MLVRFIAAALLGWSVVEVALYVAICKHNQAPVEILPCAIRSVPWLLGMGLLVKSKPVARWVAEKMEE